MNMKQSRSLEFRTEAMKLGLWQVRSRAGAARRLDIFQLSLSLLAGSWLAVILLLNRACHALGCDCFYRPNSLRPG
jgi:hypothetical protein